MNSDYVHAVPKPGNMFASTDGTRGSLTVSKVIAVTDEHVEVVEIRRFKSERKYWTGFSKSVCKQLNGADQIAVELAKLIL